MYYLIFGYTSCLFAQKPIIDSSVYHKWPYVCDATISNDGNYAIYNVNNVPWGNNTLVIQSTKTNWKREYPRVEHGDITSDSKLAIFEEPGDSLCLLSLESNNSRYIPHVSFYTLAGEGKWEWLAYRENTPAKMFILRNLYYGKERRFANVSNFLFSKNGNVLLLETEGKIDSNKIHELYWLNLADDSSTTIWQGEKVDNYTFDTSRCQLAFIAEEEKGNNSMIALWYYKPGMDKAVMYANERTSGVDSNLTVNTANPVFSKDGSKVFFQLIEKPLPQPKLDAVKVDIWSYNDPKLQSLQLMAGLQPKAFAAVINIDDKRIIRLQLNEEEILGSENRNRIDFELISTTKGDGAEFWWNPVSRPTIYIVSTLNGSRKILKENAACFPQYNFTFPSSPHGRWLIYFDNEQRAYFSYDRTTGVARNITKNIPAAMINDANSDLPNFGLSTLVATAVGVAGWLNNDAAILLYDEYDIWEVDPIGLKAPVNITNGYGRTHHIKFRILEEGNIHNGLSPHAILLLTAFNVISKYNGFYRKVLDAKGNPELLTMGPYNLYSVSSQLGRNESIPATLPLKARDADVWIISRRSTTEAPNYFITRDFKTYTPLSTIEPQKDYNWLTAVLIHWKTLDGTLSSGILYKPENFDPKKKYPVLFNYYEKHSDELYNFPEPQASQDNINIPYFVSRGYLVFIPDIHYKIGRVGESVVNCVISAARYLSKMPWVDAAKMGIQGHSFGGYETNYLVTHTHLFAAAAEAAGQTDFISGYGGLAYGYGGLGSSREMMYETNQSRIGATLWQRPDLYIRNSPVLKADQVRTPLLMMHNNKDGAVPFEQAVEFFTALRRLGKRVWMLQYDKEGHIVYAKDAEDYTIRLTQFFDHYLKGEAAPEWMIRGIPARWKGIRDGYELDMNAVKVH